MDLIRNINNNSDDLSLNHSNNNEGLIHEESGKNEKWRKLVITAINSTSLYLLAFLIVYLIYNILTINWAAEFGIHSRLLYWKIQWLDVKGYKAWNLHSIQQIFSIGPLSCLLLSLLFLGVYVITQNQEGLYSRFYLWIIMHSFNMFFGSIIIGIITTINYTYENQIVKVIADKVFFTMDDTYSSKGMGYMFDYMFLSSVSKFILFIITFTATVIVGYFSARYFLQSSHSASLVKNDKNRKIFMIFQTIIPWAIGTIFILIIKYPHNTRYEIYFYLSMLLLIVPSFIHVYKKPPSFKKINIIKQTGEMSISKIYLITTLIFYIIFRVAFS